jgi:hypothetical protein
MTRNFRSQAAIDYITSYGVVLLVIVIAVYAILQLGVFSLSSAPLQCAANPSFACSAVSLRTDGNLTFSLTQATGGHISINGVACSSNINSTSNLPAYGNIHVVPKISEAGTWYPAGDPYYQASIASGSSADLQVYCFGSGGASTGNLGSVYTGYIWINYTYAGLPNSYDIIDRVAQFTAKYS